MQPAIQIEATLLETEFYQAVQRFLKRGLTKERALIVSQRAITEFSLRGHGFPSVAGNGLGERATSSQPKTSGAGQRKDVSRHESARPARDLRSAAGAVGAMLAKTVFDTCKTHDGRAWGDVYGYELTNMARDGGIARDILSKLGVMTNTQHGMRVRDILRADEFSKIVEAQNA